MRLASYLANGSPQAAVLASDRPPEFLKVGDMMEAEIERIGVLRNTVAAYAGSEGDLVSSGAGRRSAEG